MGDAMSRRRNSGYSLIEVMIAVICVMASFAWTLSLVNTSVRANEDGWEQSVASQFGASWMERLKRDATKWTVAGSPVNTSYLRNVDVSGCETWFVPQPELMGEFASADAYGLDTDVVDDMRYCVNLRVGKVHEEPGQGLDSIVVGVKVFWHRSARGDVNVVDRRVGPFAAGCADVLDEDLVTRGLIRKVEFYNVVHWSQP
jgi:Tfp pilus assembly protein PilV